MARTQTLKAWAADEFDEPVPSYPTLLKYAQNGMISPSPFKAGQCWRVDKNARFIGLSIKPIVKNTDDPRLKRIMEDGQTP
ncbi:TPA: excisionase [Yersinia enterocolitica]|uniref:excisionase n=1 Tax=Yersinia aleksiciae TaxID=263819 RepID=UPI0011A9EAF0|nr:excisionase [Yersinia aleksiciae]HDL6963443.1 excisionase [Yersinia enterocolitica]MDA5499933.1 excisionase [Yersinia aleksiciae]NIL01213.1 excisionase [Yersinia aleksiciae]WQC69272.1 excisionase [Yersinia aleksiciae]HDL7736089.1 excisionase [Yersinia enterocolitica]